MTRFCSSMADCLASDRDCGGEGVARGVPGGWGDPHDGDDDGGEDAAADGGCC